MALLLGGCALGALVGLQLLLWRLDRTVADEEINEYVRDLGGRRAVFAFFEHEGATHVKATIELAADAPRLELVRRPARPVLASWVGAVSEHALADPRLAERFVCRAPESPRAFEALSAIKERLLEASERFELREVKLEDRATGGSAAASLSLVLRAGRGEIDAIGAVLDGLARALGAGGGVLVRGEDALNARCGFCHADLADEALAVVACEHCSAIVHELCWEEHGRCPVLGCKGAAPRSRER